MSIPSHQKALLLPAKGSDFVVGTIGVPTPQPDEVLIRVEACSLSHLEYKMQEHGFFISEYPAVIGLDGAGVVVAVGHGVVNATLGDRVMFVSSFQNRCGAFQQYAVVKAAVTTKVPANISFDEAATIPCNFITAVNGLYVGPVPRMERGGAGLTPFWRPDGRGKYVGQPIVIVGASSSVGQYAIQIARFSGFSPIIGVASLRNTAYLKSLGATHVVDRTLSHANVIANVRTITKWPISVVFDTVGFTETQNLGYDILTSQGTLVVVLPPAIDPAKLTPDKRVFMAHGSPYAPEFTAIDLEIYKLLPTLLARGDIKPNIPEYIPGGLGGIPEGLERLKRNEVSAKKLVVRPPETFQY